MPVYHGLCVPPQKVTHHVTLSEIAPGTHLPSPYTQNYEDKVRIKLWKSMQVFQNVSLEERPPY